MRLRLIPGHPRLLITPGQLPAFRRASLGHRRPLRERLLAGLEPCLASPPALRACIGLHPERLALGLGQAWRLTQDERYGRAAHWLLGSFEHCAASVNTGYDTWGVIAESAGMLYDWLHDYWRGQGLLRTAACITARCGQRALADARHLYILEDWHNYLLGLHSGALAAALALGDEWPEYEDGSLLRLLARLLFTGHDCADVFIQDAVAVPRTRHCLEEAMRSAGGMGFAMHGEALGAYHHIDGFEAVKMAEMWTSALTASARGRRPIWPELERVGEAILHFNQPDGRCAAIGDSTRSGATHWSVNAMLHLQARAPRADFARYLAANAAIAYEPLPNHALLRSRPPQAGPGRTVTMADSALIDPIAVLRSGRGRDATMVSFRCGRYGGGHNHLDGNSFTIWRGGALALDSGSIDYLAPGRSEYQTRTMAHNAILVRDPDEGHWIGKHGLPTVNDGGQRLVGVAYAPPHAGSGQPKGLLTEERRASLSDEYDIGRYLCFRSSGRIDYLAGDATRAYTSPWSGIGDNPSRRVEEAVRQLVFLKPDLVVVFDRVEASSAAYEKRWLLHTIGPPTVVAGGRRTRTRPGIHRLPRGVLEFSHQRGRLTVWPLLPTAQRIRAVGGSGYDCWVDHAVGANGGLNMPASRTHPEAGSWRIEVEPAEAAARHCFLTVMHAGLQRDPAAAGRFRCIAASTNGMIELRIDRRHGRAWRRLAELRFRPAGEVEAGISYGADSLAERSGMPGRVPRAGD